jgi:hypothetical protein
MGRQNRVSVVPISISLIPQGLVKGKGPPRGLLYEGCRDGDMYFVVGLDCLQTPQTRPLKSLYESPHAEWRRPAAAPWQPMVWHDPGAMPLSRSRPAKALSCCFTGNSVHPVTRLEPLYARAESACAGVWSHLLAFPLHFDVTK